MNKLKHAHKYLVFVLFSFSIYASELTEAYIELRSNSHYDSFFRVLFDDDTPYLNMNSVIPFLSGLQQTCDTFVCKYQSPSTSQAAIVTIDFQHQYCKATNNNEKKDIQSKVIDNELWLSWQAIETCFNASVYWHPNRYILKITTHHRSADDLQKNIEESRLAAIQHAKEVKNIQSQPITMPTKTTGVQGKLGLNMYYSKHAHRIEADSDFFFVTMINL